jgi:hypothetical protein
MHSSKVVGSPTTTTTTIATTKTTTTSHKNDVPSNEGISLKNDSTDEKNTQRNEPILVTPSVETIESQTATTRITETSSQSIDSYEGERIRH